MNLSAIKRRLGVIQARLAANGEGRQFPIPRHSGMRGLKAAIEAAKADRESRGVAKQEPPLGMSHSPFHALREAILKERSEREARGPEAYADVPAIYDEEPIKEPKTCTVQTTINPASSSSCASTTGITSSNSTEPSTRETN